MGCSACFTWNSPWGRFSRAFRICSIVLYVLDVITDATLAADYYIDREYVYFWATLGLVIGPAIITSAFSFYWEHETVKIRRQRYEEARRTRGADTESAVVKEEGSETEIDGEEESNQKFPQWLIVIEVLLGPLREPVMRITTQAKVWHLFLLGPLFRSLRSLFVQNRHGGKEEGLMETRDAAFLHLMESFLEAAPQIVLQLSIMINDDSANAIQITSVAFSLLSLASSIKAYLSALRSANSLLPPPNRQHKLSCKGGIMMMLWRMGMISSRGIAMAMFFSAYGAWPFLLIGIHVVFMFLWHVRQKTRFMFPQNVIYERPKNEPENDGKILLKNRDDSLKILLKEWLYDFVMAGLTVFCFMNLQNGKARWRMVTYYIIMFWENTLMVTLWCVSIDPEEREVETYILPALVWGLFLFGVIWLVIYYQYGHPNKQDHNLNAVEKFAHHVILMLKRDILINDDRMDGVRRESEV